MPRVLVSTAVVALAALSLSACHRYHRQVSINTGDGASWTDNDNDAPVTVADRLNCPQTQGALQLVSAAADGQSCAYRKDDQEDVALSRVALNGETPRGAMKPMETELAGLVAVRPDAAPVTVDASKGDGDDKAKIDLPGVHIDAHGDKAKVSVLGVTVNADGDRADVHAGAGQNLATVHAGPGGAEIRADRVGGHTANLVYILAGEASGPQGYRAVGYLARGPVAGPLVVGEFKSRSDDHGGRHDRDLEELINLNVHSAS
jgi:hypothetical protein